VVAEPTGLVVVALFYVMVTSALAALWTTASDASGSAIAGYSAAALVWYVATSEAVTVSLPMRLIEEIGDDIGSERVAIELLRPTSMLSVRLATEVGKTLPRLLVCTAIGITFATAFAGPPPDPIALGLAAPALLLAVVTNLVAQHAFAAAAFWVRDAKGTWFLYQKLVFVLGGMLLPLEVLPGWLEAAARVLPFMAMAYAPARLASGHIEPTLLAVQGFWLVVLWFAAARLFAAGEHRLLGATT
jgi:ABC-2 type transport system permease protein